MITAWFWLSACFFLLNILLFIGLVVATVMVLRLLSEMKPKIDALEQNIQGLVLKVHSVADRVEEVATSVRNTVENVGGKAKGMAGSAEIVAQSASKQFERFSPFVIGAITAIRLVTALRQFQAAKSRNFEKKAQSKVRQAVGIGRGVVKTLLHLTSK
jgi:hypothetical protein